MVNKHDSLVIREMQIKARIRRHFPPSHGQAFKKRESTSAGWVVE